MRSSVATTSRRTLGSKWSPAMAIDAHLPDGRDADDEEPRDRHHDDDRAATADAPDVAAALPEASRTVSPAATCSR
jgi:hypothetical protein